MSKVMFFDSMEMASADPILSLAEAYWSDGRELKVNLGVGVFVNDHGQTPVLESVKRAERRLWETEHSKNYDPISGRPEYGRAVARLVFGEEFHGLASNAVAVAQTPGGTGALRVGAELLRAFRGQGAVWLPSPTWGNHPGVFGAAGLSLQTYPYYDGGRHAVDFEAMASALEKVPRGDVVLLHVCCHNPTGGDLSAEQWDRVAELAVQGGWLPFFDFAYQGFGSGLEADRAGLLAVLRKVPEALVASSFSKNMGLYSERVGALSVVASGAGSAQRALSQVKRIIRVIYSNPPRHGGALARLVLEDGELRELWGEEVRAMRQRIQALRQALAEGLSARNPGMDFSYITAQHGMFSFSGLNDDQVDFLRVEKGIYMVRGGRMNVAGLSVQNLDYVCDSITESLRR